MKNNISLKKSRYDVNALLLVAHPDDETIYCGGTMLYYKKWKWTVFCVTQQNSERYQEFRHAITSFKKLNVNIVQSGTLGKEDINRKFREEEKLDWKRSIESKNWQPDIVLTHNKEGYHHDAHDVVKEICYELYQNVWEFVYPGPDPKITPSEIKSQLKKIPLTKNALAQKEEIFNNCYLSQDGLWEGIPGVLEYEFQKGPEQFTSEIGNWPK